MKHFLVIKPVEGIRAAQWKVYGIITVTCIHRIITA